MRWVSNHRFRIVADKAHPLDNIIWPAAIITTLIATLASPCAPQIYKLPAFNGGDLGEGEQKDGLLKLMSFTQDLEEIIIGEREATFVIEDTGNHVSVSSPYDIVEEDVHLKVER